MTGVAFEWTFRAGDILTLVSAFAIAAAFLYRKGDEASTIRLTLKSLADQLDEMKTEFKTFGSTLTDVAVQKSQIALLMKWYDELRRGEGFVQGARGIDREYGGD